MIDIFKKREMSEKRQIKNGFVNAEGVAAFCLEFIHLRESIDPQEDNHFNRVWKDFLELKPYEVKEILAFGAGSLDNSHEYHEKLKAFINEYFVIKKRYWSIRYPLSK
jgi:hypothetical protein